ncbi:HK97 gp10 family phage protein, partial [Klebsiella pneumoniae]|nr:HK97 gp10 family phage protein [Klebsiella pneumoniae]MCP6606576.1 HK97 gp10 family phage protein [Klebsiella pneumoniae]MCP6717761.1 HK97 gp10 family phage protein [Klebsiella pneumoniae]
RVGYSANYAVYVHDPAVKQDFTRATARKEFLTKGFEDTRSQIDAVVKKELSL